MLTLLEAEWFEGAKGQDIRCGISCFVAVFTPSSREQVGVEPQGDHNGRPVYVELCEDGFVHRALRIYYLVSRVTCITGHG